ncbi:hypothetical protein BN946_scf184921.g10 [Trametes cinnabarina]|uniref:J domain-containing protein n=1 Tax=Pycnoporus cinnabarinus TaxID=5643 RepID=A0A060SU37_PYCCI|nr:hypothetical protein BN946_scf184921.g10 [Trametes cinnabarina]
MPGTGDPAVSAGIPEDKEYYYSILNLPKTASDHEIRERYRQLSIIFHPDKQTDERRKEAATERFLELQKAYEVLSDPVTRAGPEGLLLLQSADLRNVAEEEFEEELRRQQRELHRLRVEQAIHPKGNIIVGIDASPFFDHEYETEDGSQLSRWQHLQASLGDVRRDTFAAQIRDKTWLLMSGRVTTGSKPPPEQGSYVRSVLMGTVKHQFSPRLDFEATTNLLAVSGVSMKGTYHTAEYTVTCQTGVHPLLFLQLFTYRKGDALLLPGVNVSLARRLFPKSPMQGVLELGLTSVGPKISAALASSTFYDSTGGDDTDPQPSDGTSAFRAPSVSGLAYYSTEWQFGFDLAGPASGLNGRYALIFHELGVDIQTVVRLGLAEIMWLFGGEWRGTNAAVGANVSASTGGVTLRVEFLDEARRQLREEKSELLRQWKETVSLLQDTAQRHMRAEEACDGLVILEARYGPSEEEEGTEGLEVDVTVPVQALVNSSQLYIPGKRSKAGIPGFYDPVVGVPKTLRIRYKFRGRLHYAEIPDYMPVVLPLKVWPPAPLWMAGGSAHVGITW